MAEALGIASGVTALVTIAAQLTKLSYTLIVDIKNAPRVQKQYLQEISALTDVLLRADSASEAASRLGLDIQRPDALTSTVLTEYQQQLLSLKSDLEGGLKRICWPLREKETRRHIEQLQRFQSILNDFFSANTLAATAQTYSIVNKASQQNAKHHFLQWLEKYSAPALPLPAAFQGTGRWFVEGGAYAAWVQDSPSILWVRGAPGSGKTMLSSIAVRELLESSSSAQIPVASYVCDWSSRKQQSTSAVLVNILHQFAADGDDTMIESLRKVRRSTSREPTAAEVGEMLVLACTLSSKPCLVIDALDELEDARGMAQFLPKLVNASCRVIVTSRPIPDMDKELVDATHFELQANPEDLRTYITGRFEETHPAVTTTKNSDFVEAIVSRAGDIFLLARIFVEHLLDLTTVKQMRKALPNLPTHLGEAYESSTRRIDQQSSARRNLAYRVIAWITHAARRLTAEELVHAFAVEDGDDELDEDNILDLQLVLQACVGLVVLHSEDRTLGMVHTSAYEYFRDRNADNTQEDMASTCLTYLQLGPLRSGPCADAAAMDDRLTSMPFLRYAAKHFSGHIRDGDLERTLASEIGALLEDSSLRASAWQAVHYRAGLTDKTVAAELLDSIPHSQTALHLAAFWNLRLTVTDHLEKADQVLVCDSQDWTALHWACREGNRDVAEILVSHGADVNAKDSAGWTPIFWFALKGSAEGLRMLLRHGADHRSRDAHNWTALHWATSAQQKTVIEVLLAHEKGLDGNELSQEPPLTFETPKGDGKLKAARIACYGRNLADVDEASDIDLYAVLVNKHPTITSADVAKLLSSDALDPPVGNIWRTLNKKDFMYKSEWEDRQRLFRSAIRQSKLGAMKSLIAAGIDVNHADCDGLPPLHRAVSNGFVDAALILLQAGADVSAMCKAGRHGGSYGPVWHHSVASSNLGGASSRSALMLACGIEQPLVRTEMIALLLSYGADVNKTDNLGGSVLQYSAMSGDVDIIRRLIDAGAGLASKHRSGMSVLHCAAEQGSLSTLKYLMDAGANPHAKDHQGRSPIHYWAGANRSGKHDVSELPAVLSLFIATYGIKALSESFRYGEERLRRDKSYQAINTPLSSALKAQNWTLVKLLHRAGAAFPCDCPEANKSQFLGNAVRAADSEVLQITLGYCSDLDLTAEASGRYGGFSFFRSLESVDADLVKVRILQTAGMDITFDHNRVLLQAIEIKAPQQVIQGLLDMGSDPFGPSPHNGNRDVFIEAFMRSGFEALECLVGQAIRHPRDDHWTRKLEPSGSSSVMQNVSQALSTSGVLNEYCDPDGRSLLWLSCDAGDSEVCELLLDVGADIERADTRGWRPLHIAAYRGYESVVKGLLRRGADPASYTEAWPVPCDYREKNKLPSSWYYGKHWRGQPLHLAAFQRHTAVVKALVNDDRVDVNACAHHFKRPLALDGEFAWDTKDEETKQSALSMILRPQDADFTSAAKHAREIADSEETKAVLELLRLHGGIVIPQS